MRTHEEFIRENFTLEEQADFQKACEEEQVEIDKEARLSEIEKRLEKTTPGEWLWEPIDHESENLCSHTEDGNRSGGCISILQGILDTGNINGLPENKEFIAHSPEDIKWLIEELKFSRQQHSGALNAYNEKSEEVKRLWKPAEHQYIARGELLGLELEDILCGITNRLDEYDLIFEIETMLHDFKDSPEKFRARVKEQEDEMKKLQEEQDD